MQLLEHLPMEKLLAQIFFEKTLDRLAVVMVVAGAF